MIVAAATGARRLSRAELRRVLDHVAQAGFDQAAREKAGGRLARLEWRGRVLKGVDRLSPAEAHYLRHVVVRREWPAGTSLEVYLHSLEDVIRNPASGVFVSRYQGKAWQVAVVGRSGPLRGPQGYEWVMVEYRLDTGHWVTGFQPERGLAHLKSPKREHGRWLRRPK